VSGVERAKQQEREYAEQAFSQVGRGESATSGTMTGEDVHGKIGMTQGTGND
jgi:hypothetical protein